MTVLTQTVRGYVRVRGGRATIDWRRKPGSLIANGIILDELQRFLREHFPGGGEHLLDVGAGAKPYEPVYRAHFAASTSVDIAESPHDVSRVDVLAPVEELPFAADSCDCVLCTEVLEHSAEPRRALAELYRVLRPGGKVFLTTPFLVPLHEMPHDYFRYTPSSLLRMSEEAGFRVLSIRPRGEYLAVALGFAALPWSKVWQRLAARLRLPLSHPYNPLIFIPVVLPQVVYLRLWRAVRNAPESFVGRIAAKSDYVTLGYVTVLEKAEESP